MPKAKPNALAFGLLNLLTILSVSGFLEAFSAINRFSTAGLERNLGDATTFITNSFKHLPLGSAVTVITGITLFASRPTSRTTGRIILESFLSKEFLLTCRKYKFRSTVTTLKGPVRKHQTYLLRKIDSLNFLGANQVNYPYLTPINSGGDSPVSVKNLEVT